MAMTDEEASKKHFDIGELRIQLEAVRRKLAEFDEDLGRLQALLNDMRGFSYRHKMYLRHAEDFLTAVGDVPVAKRR